MHYRNSEERERLLKDNPGLFTDKKEGRVLQFINLCIHPYDFRIIFRTLRTEARVSLKTYNALKGTIAGMLVLTNRKNAHSFYSIEQYVLDFIDFIRKYPRDNAEGFLLAMKMYMPRYLCLRGLEASFGIDWRQLVTDALELKNMPNPKSFHSLFTGYYPAFVLRAYLVWKQYKEPTDEGYKEGVNDLLTLLEKHRKFKTEARQMPFERFSMLFTALKESLPSWNASVRVKAAFAIDTAQDGRAIVERPFSSLREEKAARYN